MLDGGAVSRGGGCANCTTGIDRDVARARVISTVAPREHLVTFGRERHLVGVVAEPAEKHVAPPGLVLGAGILHRGGPSRAAVLAARHLAARGVPVLRFDLSGIGDSRRLGDRPLALAVIDDIRSAVDLLVERWPWAQDGRVQLLGFCSGADNAWVYAEGDSRVSTLALFDPWVHPTVGFQVRRLQTARRQPSCRFGSCGPLGAHWNVASRRFRRPSTMACCCQIDRQRAESPAH